MPANADWLLPATIAIDAGGPATPTTVIRSGESSPTVTVSVFAPAVRPSVQVPTGVGDPEVVVPEVPVMVPPPAVTAMVNGTPPMIAPLASSTENVGAVVNASPAVPLGRLPATCTDLGIGGSVLLHPDPVTAATMESAITRAYLTDDARGKCIGCRERENAAKSGFENMKQCTMRRKKF